MSFAFWVVHSERRGVPAKPPPPPPPSKTSLRRAPGALQLQLRTHTLALKAVQHGPLNGSMLFLIG